MPYVHRRQLIALAATALLAAVPLVGQAQAFPAGNAPIHIVVPYSAGGSSDFLARQVGRMLADNLKHPVVIDNRPGGNTIIGAESVARAKPDGYTLYLIGALTHGSLKALNEKLPFDPMKDFAGVTNLIASPLVVSVPAAFPAKTLKEFVDYAKARPGEINYGSAGLGNTLHQGAENFAHLTGLKLNHVQYKGASQAVLDLLAGRIQVMFDLPQTQAPHIQSGKLRGLAITSPTRLPMLPDVPTTAEAGFPDYRFVTRVGLAAPGGTPQPILQRLYAEVSKIVANPEFRKAVEEKAMFPDPSASPADFQKLLQDSQNSVSELLKGVSK